MRWLRKGLGFMWSGAGAGVATAAAGLLTGQGGMLTMGLQMAAGGAVKKLSKRAGREIHRIGSPAASLAVLVGAKALGMDVPVELAAVGAADAGMVSTLLETLLNGVLPGGLQSTTNSARKAARQFKENGGW